MYNLCPKNTEDSEIKADPFVTGSPNVTVGLIYPLPLVSTIIEFKNVGSSALYPSLALIVMLAVV